MLHRRNGALHRLAPFGGICGRDPPGKPSYIVGGLTIVLQMFSLADDQKLVEICLAPP